jgi:hypothetical protein
MNDESSMNTRSDTSCRFGSTDIKCRGGMRVSVIVIALAWIARSARSAVVKLDLRDARDRERWRDALAEVEVAAYAFSRSYRAGLAGFHALERVERTSSDKVRFNHTSVIFALASNKTLGAKVSTSFEEFFFGGTKLAEMDVGVACHNVRRDIRTSSLISCAAGEDNDAFIAEEIDSATVPVSMSCVDDIVSQLEASLALLL